MSLSRLARLAKALGPAELARRMGRSEKTAKQWLRRPPKGKDFAEALRILERRHEAAKVAAHHRHKAPKKFEPLKKKAPKKIKRKGLDQRSAIRESLDHLAKLFEGSRTKTHVFPSGQVRAELRIPMPKRRSVDDVLLDLAENAHFKPGVWLSTGFLSRQTREQKTRSPAPRYRGLARIQASPQKNKLAEQVITSQGIWKHMREAGYKRPKEIIVRVAWNPSGKQESFRRKKPGRRKR